MSLITAVRRTARHRGKSVGDLQKEIDTLRGEVDGKECEIVHLNLLLDELGTAYLNLQTARRNEISDLEAALETARQATTAANERTRLLDGELAEAKGEIRNLQAQLTALRATIQPRDTSDPRDQVTEPIRHVGDEFPDDYLNQTRQSWRGPVVEVKPQPVRKADLRVAFKPKPLSEAPFAMDRPPASPTDLPGETTLTLRVTAA